MELRDILVTPIVLLLIFAVAYLIRPWLATPEIKKYYFPALTLKIVGALALGFIYQFYYSGGDTYNYHTFGSRIVWEAFMNDPVDGMSLILSPTGDHHLYKYTSRIIFITDPSSFFIVRMAAILDLFTYSTYSATATIFAFISFLGVWFFFLTFYQLFPHLKHRIAICALFIPSVVFWGSGLMKDSILMAAIGVATYCVKRLLIDREFSLIKIMLLILSLFVVFEVKKYVLLCFVPASMFWIYASNLQRIRSVIVRIMLLPVMIVVSVVTGYITIEQIAASDQRYALDKLAQTARITAYDIRYMTGRDAGSGYSLGELDGTFAGMVRLLPQAINVSLFRPYLWEVNNPLMLLSSLEASVLLLITLYLLFRWPARFFKSMKDPTVLFCLIFSLTFAFAVGVSTYNFGTLVRYRIPMLPFYLLALIIIADYPNSEKKLDTLDSTV